MDVRWEGGKWEATRICDENFQTQYPTAAPPKKNGHWKCAEGRSMVEQVPAGAFARTRSSRCHLGHTALEEFRREAVESAGTVYLPRESGLFPSLLWPLLWRLEISALAEGASPPPARHPSGAQTPTAELLRRPHPRSGEFPLLHRITRNPCRSSRLRAGGARENVGRASVVGGGRAFARAVASDPARLDRCATRGRARGEAPARWPNVRGNSSGEEPRDRAGKPIRRGRVFRDAPRRSRTLSPRAPRARFRRGRPGEGGAGGLTGREGYGARWGRAGGSPRRLPPEESRGCASPSRHPRADVGRSGPRSSPGRRQTQTRSWVCIPPYVASDCLRADPRGLCLFFAFATCPVGSSAPIRAARSPAAMSGISATPEWKALAEHAKTIKDQCVLRVDREIGGRAAQRPLDRSSAAPGSEKEREVGWAGVEGEGWTGASKWARCAACKGRRVGGGGERGGGVSVYRSRLGALSCRGRASRSG